MDLAEEDAHFMEYLKRNGWEGEVGEDDETDLIGREPSNRSTTASVHHT